MNVCQYCGSAHGVRCPSVKAFEYHPDGTVKRVEFMTPIDLIPTPVAAGIKYEPYWRQPGYPFVTTCEASNGH